MTDKLPPPLLALFTPRPPLKYLLPADHPIEDRRTAKIDGISGFLFALKEEPVPYNATESWLQKKDRQKLEKQEKQKDYLTRVFEEEYKPHEDKKIKGSAFSTLFVGRLDYNTSKEHLYDHFGRFGPIERVRVVGAEDPKNPGMGKSRGYAFVVFANERDMKAAYKASEHLMLGGRRVIVDVERGRTVKGWRPRRFGGGLGGRGSQKAEIKKFGDRFSGGPGPFRGGGFRGSRGGGGYRGRGGYDRGPRNGYDAPAGAPQGPRGSSFGGDRGYGGGGRNANYEPVAPRSGGYGGGGGGGYGGGRRDHYDDRRRY